MKKIPAVGQVRGDINVTPLVDVCLVLLIIFMVVTPLLNKGPAVTLPETRKPSAIPESSEQITLTLRADGSMLYGERAIASGELPALLAELRTRNAERRIVVRGDRKLSYGAVRAVLKQVSDAGFRNAGLATERMPPATT